MLKVIYLNLYFYHITQIFFICQIVCSRLLVSRDNNIEKAGRQRACRARERKGEARRACTCKYCFKTSIQYNSSGIPCGWLLLAVYINTLSTCLEPSDTSVTWQECYIHMILRIAFLHKKHSEWNKEFNLINLKAYKAKISI